MRLLALVLVFALVAGCNGFLGPGGRDPGAAARELVDPRVHAKLVVEIDYPVGAAPNAEAKSVLKSTLVEVTGRSAANIELVESADIPSEPNRKYSTAEIIALENEHRDRRSSGDTAVFYVMYLAGGSTSDDGDSRVLGVAYGGTSVAMFKANIREGTRSPLLGIGAVGENCIERAVLVHEFGHVAGLVNLGTPMVRNHEDPAHPKHSSNKASVMYYAVENTLDLLSLFGSCGEIPYQFDGDDKADLAALRR